MEAAVRAFFASSRFGVAGASSDPSKFGYKILNWYASRNLSVTGINGRSPPGTIRITSPAGTNRDIKLVTSTSQLVVDQDTDSQPTSPANGVDVSLSIVTPPRVTLSLLKDAVDAGIRRLWFQPGTFDQACLDFIAPPAGQGTGNFDVAIVPGYNTNMAVRSSGSSIAKSAVGLQSTGEEGWCVLMDGDIGLGLAQKNPRM